MKRALSMRLCTRPIFLLGVLVLITGGLTGCAGSGGSSETPAPAARTGGVSAGGGTDMNLVVTVQGQLFVKRNGWKDYAPALFGTVVRRGDLLKLAASSQAKVACSDLTVADIQDGVGGVPCKGDRPVISEGNGEIIATRGGEPGAYPMVISPRKTSVLGTHPLIKWTAVDGASGYTVSVRGSGVDWTSTEEVQDTQLAYPDDAPPLQPGETYKVVVQAGDASSDQEGVPGLGFTVLGADEAQAVRDAEGRIKALRLDPASESLLVAHLYQSHKLYSEAEQTLSGVAANAKSPAVSRLLGDLYATTGLNRPAEEQYVSALALSKAEGDIEGQALAQGKLGRVYSALGNKDQAAASLQQALDVYSKLGDITMTEQINQELAEVK